MSLSILKHFRYSAEIITGDKCCYADEWFRASRGIETYPDKISIVLL